MSRLIIGLYVNSNTYKLSSGSRQILTSVKSICCIIIVHVFRVGLLMYLPCHVSN